MNNTLIYDQPRSAGVENALRRARHLLDMRWTPAQEICLKDVPGTNGYIYPARNGKTPEAPVESPIPYSSARVEHNLVGVDISFDTFMTAVRNPASVIYTRNLGDFDDPAFNCAISNAYFPYGTVCSAFANHVLDLPIHRCTHEWSSSPEFYEVLDRSADALSLCDTLRHHQA